jgi:hypothetical protein
MDPKNKAPTADDEAIVADGTDFNEVIDFVEDDELEGTSFAETPAEPEEAEVEKPAEPEEEGAEAATQTPPEDAAEPAAPEEPKEPVVEPPAQPETSAEEVEKTFQQEYKDWLDRGVDTLEKSGIYTLDDEDAEALAMSDAEGVKKVVAKLGARMHMQVLSAAVTQAANMLPQLIPVVTQGLEQRNQEVESFYKDYPKLADHKDVVDSIALAMARANPKMPKDALRQRIAAASMMSVGIVPDDFRPQPSPVSAPPAPASAAALQSPPPVQEKSVWDGLIEIEDE